MFVTIDPSLGTADAGIEREEDALRNSGVCVCVCVCVFVFVCVCVCTCAV